MMPEDRQELYRLIRRRTELRIISRLTPFSHFSQWGQAAYDADEIEDQILDLMFGTHDFVELGRRWKLPIDPEKRKSQLKGDGNERSTRRGSNQSHRKSLL
jgi:hypothetical protein